MSRRSDSHRSRSPIVHRRGFSNTLEGSMGKGGGNGNPVNLAASLPPTSLMGSLLASQQAKVAEEAKAKEAAVRRASGTGSMSAIANAAADMLKSARNNSGTGSFIEGSLVILPNMDKDNEQRRLDIEMQRRRDRIERWRREKKLKQDILAMQQKTLETARRAQKGKWNLEDDDDDEESLKKPKQTVNNADENEVDPLDAYMQEVNAELRSASEVNKPKLAIKVEPGKGQDTINKKAEDGQIGLKRKKPEMVKGELMESNIDELEYSSEEDDETIEDALAQLQKKEKLIAVDHSKIAYEPFRKDFYIEVPEIAKMSKEDLKAYRTSLENIRVRGKDCPKPIKNWAQSGISSRSLACLKRHKFDKPTPIQCQALPVIMSGRDMIGIAKTGSGKTLAFLIPLMRHIRQQRPLEAGEGPLALLLAPTRELALQIYKEAKTLCQAIDARVVCVYGGTGISEQISELKRGAEIIVCTPGRMIDMLTANGGRVTNLRRCTYVVLDEADRMFDLGFEPQVMRIVENCRPDRQTLMFSATFPRQMEFLARKALTLPIEVQVGGRSVVCSDVDQHVVVITEDEKVHKVLELLGVFQEVGSVLIFVEKQESADELMHVLLKYGYPCLSLHGGIDQYDRDSVITDFKRGTIRLLIATSVAARGLDVPELLLVVNYDCPNHYEDYVHRCGRTGRAGSKGFAYTFLTPDQERNAGDVVRAFKQSGQKPPEELFTMWNSYKKRMESEGKKVYGSSGFRGKGFMFDENEAQLNNEKRRFQKAALGLQDDSDDGDEDGNAVDWDAKIEDMLGTKRRIKEVLKGPSAAEQAAAVHADLASSQANQTPISAALALARQKAAQLTRNLTPVASAVTTAVSTNAALTTNSTSKFTTHPNITPPGIPFVDAAQATAIAVMKGQTVSVTTASATAMSATSGGGAVSSAASSGLSASRSLAEQAAERLNMKLGYCKLAVSADSSGDATADGKEEKSGETVRRFEEELAINDFPQNVRWRITGREMLSHISEYCDVGISVRGVYMPPAAAARARQNPSAENDERPLFLCIEAVAERQIASAKKEIMRVIKEELLKSSSSAANRGRYKVV